MKNIRNMLGFDKTKAIKMAHSAITSPRPRPDDIEEMMRIAVELSDREVQFLNELVGIQGAFGLVSRVPPPSNLTIAADIQNRFALLRKGVDFVRFAKQH